ncbi:MAG TPA: hypothetical protein VFG39_09430, partial [Balneolaceae bacterium]|nr:hypothetical protein [Balneolaceae bacterium]
GENMADVPVQKVTLSGLSPSFQAADSAGDSFVNDGKTILHFVNDDAVEKMVTVESVSKCNFGFDHDLTLTVPATSELKAGPFPTARFNADGKVTIAYDDVTSLTVAAFQD